MIFAVVAALLFIYLNQVFNIADSDSNKEIFNAFYEEEENTIDVVYFGTSEMCIRDRSMAVTP